MQFEVRIKKKALRNLKKLPTNVRKLLFLLIEDLKADGPIQKSWHNFSPLGKETYHCHLNYRYVACWTSRQGEIIINIHSPGQWQKEQ